MAAHCQWCVTFPVRFPSIARLTSPFHALFDAPRHMTRCVPCLCRSQITGSLTPSSWANSLHGSLCASNVLFDTCKGPLP